jgi:peptide chain release factor 1
MQDERSQLQNRLRAMTVLRSRLFDLAERERREEMSDARRSQTGGGGRSEKIRTYNYKENRVTDHRIGFTIYRLAEVLRGDLQPVVDALAADERARLLAEGDV